MRSRSDDACDDRCDGRNADPADPTRPGAGPSDADRDASGRDFTSRRERRERGARIARELADELRHAAEELRIPVANLVRGVVDEALDAAERVSGDLGGLVEDLVSHAERARRGLEARGFGRRSRRHRAWSDAPSEHPSRPDAEDRADREARPSPAPAARPVGADVVGWVAITLERDASCATCWRELPRGSAAHVGIGTEPPVVVCAGCREGRFPAG